MPVWKPINSFLPSGVAPISTSMHSACGSIIEDSPAVSIKAPSARRQGPSAARSDPQDELKTLWHTCDQLGAPYGAFAQFLILTACRRTEAARLPWSELDLDCGTWTLPPERAKNGVQFITFLPEPAIELLRSIPRNGAYVFSFSNGERPINGFHYLKRKIDALMPPETRPWRLHDLRRTAATQWSRLRIDRDVREALLNHAKPRLAGTYDTHEFALEKRDGLALWARELDAIVHGRTETNVVSLR
jgi:integrase